MRTDLKLNYGALDIVSARIKAYYDAIEDMEKALEGLKGVLENQESERWKSCWKRLETQQQIWKAKRQR